ncbi:uncharacterized protein [Zea mays]|uniref:Ankyrin repeat family protein / regulator of chromosome condensation (RCC1) family protein n=1 Tax=Zea mays TaxID=4577 RepID=A0A1D6HSY5_MAIZE|nr:uncharacterized protein LOC103631979 isoform X3 [Zea mays]XP_035816703.1 uncharacterized protein LOC103631979 isoform X3 [Zea mays]ONM51499.1 ankyrin repeat family protein / regulator of chromosome condensation (RCC1) family protein [Zea mays]ONM51503.1 ankyrin repeat family protein / regulator of chromosome condensation (RCC1) family protein [Zea mays]ONM51509.1 ankyrin repeat family protein / regulator of chromosome condensation (RCC1) family protein [Zea mays]ONM51515.1 ankyrin repeat fa|eukprot:XP_020396521.1 uncharacterized protein LOC103631979 isoform X3 [Zea mays]
METSISPPGTSKQSAVRKPSPGSSLKDLCLVSKQGSIAEVESALALLKKSGGNIDGRNAFGLSALHLATWRNHLPIVRRLLDAGADPDARDGESGWSSLHRALHFGHLCIAGVLLQFGASLALEDTKGRTPVDLISCPVSQANGDFPDAVATEVFSWGSGTNYQLGTGNAHIQKLPCKVEALHGSYIKTVAASKFHSVAVSSNGELYTWGFGRGGRLGHPDIHSGQTTAVITPRQVTVGLGRKRVNAVAAAKHHTVIATELGELFTWGSNREGQLGYPSVDTQPTPRRVGSLKQRIISVAAANKHSAAVADTGEVFTWGCNKEGQLGYGTSNSASNCIPRMVEYLKGKVLRGVSAAKYHTIVLGADGEVFTWGHRLVTPRRVVVARCLKKGGNTNLKFHRMERLQVISVAAGTTHNTALTADGALFYWVSSDPDLKCQQIFSMCGRNIVNISAGKYWTAVATSTGDVFMWDAKKRKDETPIFTRVHGVKRATFVCVGETHMLVLSSIYHPEYPPKPKSQGLKSMLEWNGGTEELGEDILFDDVQPNSGLSGSSGEMSKGVPSLKSLCEKVAVEYLLEPKNSIQLLEIADSLEAKELKKHCEDLAIRNLDYIFTVGASSIMNASSEILVNLEKLLDEKSSEPWSQHRLPTMTATYPAVIDSDVEEDEAREFPKTRKCGKSASRPSAMSSDDSFLQKDCTAEQAVSKQIRALRKKLQQIEILEAKQLAGHQLDSQQVAKLESRAALEGELAELGIPSEIYSTSSACPAEGRTNRKPEVSKKQKRKNKQSTQTPSVKNEPGQQIPITELQVLQVNVSAEKQEAYAADPIKPMEAAAFSNTKDTASPPEKKPSQPTPSKKKNRKGGLSLFLSGALDDTPKPSLPAPAVPATPKPEGPAWGGVKITKGPASLRDIQTEQSRTNEPASAKAKDRHENSPDSAGRATRLSSFIPDARSSPVAVVAPARAAAAPSSEGDRSTPPWSSSATSPNVSQPSLRDIQQMQQRHHGGVSHSPKTQTSGFCIPPHGGAPEAAGGGGVKDNVPNRWFRPETDAPSSIRSIQIEEQAMKDFRRFYSSVRIVKPQV